MKQKTTQCTTSHIHINTVYQHIIVHVHKVLDSLAVIYIGVGTILSLGGHICNILTLFSLTMKYLKNSCVNFALFSVNEFWNF